jgi:hypothetical protein
VSIQIGEQLEPAAAPGTCPGNGLGPFVRYGGGAGSADRADSAGGVPALGCCEEFFVEHTQPHMRVARRGRRRLFPADELRREAAEYAVCTGRSER